MPQDILDAGLYNIMKRILIIEDEAPMLRALFQKFNRAGFQAITARNGEDGLRVALKEQPDLVLLDIIMPKMDGLSVAKKIRQDKWGSSVPIVILTNLSDPDQVAKAAKFEVYDFLVKTDWRLDDIINFVKEKLDE